MHCPGKGRPIACACIISQHCSKGTLLYIKIGGFDFLSAQTLDHLQQTSESISNLVVKAVKDNRGVMHTLCHDHFLATWNLVLQCSQYAQHALTAAIQIRDAFHTAVEDVWGGKAISMGVWSGAVVCSSVGPAELKAFGLVGQGPKRVCLCLSCMQVPSRKARIFPLLEPCRNTVPK